MKSRLRKRIESEVGSKSMNHWIKKIVFFFASLCIVNTSIYASVVGELVSQIESQFVDISVDPAEGGDGQRGLQDLSLDHTLLTMGSSGFAVDSVVDQTPPSVHSAQSSPSTRWIGLLPVSQEFFLRVLGTNPSGSSEVSSLPVTGVKYKSTGMRDSVQEFFDVLNQLAKEEEVPFRFKLPEEEDYYLSVRRGGVVLGGVQEWTATRASAPYVSRLVLGFDPELSPHKGVTILDEGTLPQLDVMYLHPSFFSDKTKLGFRIVIEVKPKAARVLFE